LGLSGISNDIRDVREAAASGNPDAQLAIECLIHSIRHWIGAFMVELGGIDALVFTAGIGEHSASTRAAICADLEPLGLALDPVKNQAARGIEAELTAAGSPGRVLVIPANEELVVARETRRLLEARRA
jgi:acetate kinase